MAHTENQSATQWIILDPSGNRVNAKLLSESDASSELDKLNKKMLTEGKDGSRFSKKQYLLG